MGLSLENQIVPPANILTQVKQAQPPVFKTPITVPASPPIAAPASPVQEA